MPELRVRSIKRNVPGRPWKGLLAFLGLETELSPLFSRGCFLPGGDSGKFLSRRGVFRVVFIFRIGNLHKHCRCCSVKSTHPRIAGFDWQDGLITGDPTWNERFQRVHRAGAREQISRIPTTDSTGTRGG